MWTESTSVSATRLSGSYYYMFCLERFSTCSSYRKSIVPRLFSSSYYYIYYSDKAPEVRLSKSIVRSVALKVFSLETGYFEIEELVNTTVEEQNLDIVKKDNLVLLRAY